jgi:hypothetical protein
MSEASIDQPLSYERPLIAAHFLELPGPDRQLPEHFPAEENGMDVGEMLAVAYNMAFKSYGKPNRIEMVSGRRKRFLVTKVE